jgi:hypothetical protein
MTTAHDDGPIVVSFFHDDSGRPSRRVTTKSDASGAEEWSLESEVTYDDRGRVLSEWWLDYEYEDDRVARIFERRQGEPPLLRASFTYAPDGFIASASTSSGEHWTLSVTDDVAVWSSEHEERTVRFTRDATSHAFEQPWVFPLEESSEFWRLFGRLP